MCVACFEALLRIMGLSESKKTYRRENSINPANGTDNPGFGICAHSNNKSVEKLDVDMTVVTNLDDKSSRKVDHVKSAMNTVCRKRDRAVKLKRTCSKYTALDGKAANEGEIYDIDDQSDHGGDNAKSDADKDMPFDFHAKCVLDRPDTCKEELEKDHSSAPSHGKDTERLEEGVGKPSLKYVSVGEEQRTSSECKRKCRHENDFRDTSVSRNNMDILNGTRSPRDNEGMNRFVTRRRCHAKGRCEETNGKLSKTFAWPSSERLFMSSAANFQENEMSDCYQLVVDDYCANGHYVSTSISLPYNNLSNFPTDMKRVDRKTEHDTDFHATTCPNNYTQKEFTNVHRRGDEYAPLKSNVEYEVKGENKYRLVRYPLRIKVNPYEDVCEVSLPQKMIDELYISKV